MSKTVDRYIMIERAARLGVHVLHAQSPADGEIEAVHLFAPSQNDIEDALDKIEGMIYDGKSHVSWIVLHINRATFPNKE